MSARELALQLAVAHLLPNDTAESIVARAAKYEEFLYEGRVTKDVGGRSSSETGPR